MIKCFLLLRQLVGLTFFQGFNFPSLSRTNNFFDLFLTQRSLLPPLSLPAVASFPNELAALPLAF